MVEISRPKGLRKIDIEAVEQALQQERLAIGGVTDIKFLPRRNPVKHARRRAPWILPKDQPLKQIRGR